MRPAAFASVTLLAPGDRYGPLQSEFYARTPAKLVEAPYISRIGGKYALIYSTGAYLTSATKRQSRGPTPSCQRPVRITARCSSPIHWPYGTTQAGRRCAT